MEFMFLEFCNITLLLEKYLNNLALYRFLFCHDLKNFITIA